MKCTAERERERTNGLSILAFALITMKCTAERERERERCIFKWD
jgi:hypothetical protein